MADQVLWPAVCARRLAELEVNISAADAERVARLISDCDERFLYGEDDPGTAAEVGYSGHAVQILR